MADWLPEVVDGRRNYRRYRNSIPSIS